MSDLTIVLAFLLGALISGYTFHSVGYAGGILNGWNLAVVQCTDDIKKCVPVPQEEKP